MDAASKTDADNFNVAQARLLAAMFAALNYETLTDERLANITTGAWEHIAERRNETSC
jgi:hypothetical protein